MGKVKFRDLVTFKMLDNNLMKVKDDFQGLVPSPNLNQNASMHQTKKVCMFALQLY